MFPGALGASSNAYQARRVYVPNLQKATCLSGCCSHRPTHVEKPRGWQRSGEMCLFSDAMEQGPIPKPFLLLLQEMGARQRKP